MSEMKTVAVEEVKPAVSEEHSKLQARHMRESTKTMKYETNLTFVTPTLLSWNSTVIPSSLRRAEVWFFSTLHLVLFVLDQMYRDGHIDGPEDMTGFVRRSDSYWNRINLSFSSTGLITFLMVFMFTFWINSCYGRYLGYYGACMGMGGTLMSIAQRLAVDLENLPDDRWNIVRYITASIEFIYGETQRGKGPSAELKDLFWKRLTSTEEEFLGRAIKNPEGVKIVCKPLLTEAEAETLKKFEGNRCMLLMVWAMKAAAMGYEKIGIMRAGNPIYGDIMAIKSHGASILTKVKLPVPFPYYHLLLLLTFLNYFTFAFAFCMLDSALSPVVYFLTVLLLTGVRQLGNELADPFGEDAQDFPVMKYMTDIRSSVAPIIETTWYPTVVPTKIEDIRSMNTHVAVWGIDHLDGKGFFKNGP